MEWVMDSLKKFMNDEALIIDDEVYLYSDIISKTNEWRKKIIIEEVENQEVVVLFGEVCVEMLCAMLALILNKNIVVPISKERKENLSQMLKVSGADKMYVFKKDRVSLKPLKNEESNELLDIIRYEGEAGIIIFTSGSTGEGKCTLHRFSSLTYKIRKLEERRALRTVVFLKLDHIGGINTVFSTLLQGGTMVLIKDRTIKTVCKNIEKHQVELLPTTPTFLNMMMISGACIEYDLSSLKLITYGTEPMPLTTLNAVNRQLKNVKFKQTYGLTEMGIFPTQSKESSSVWMKIGGEGVEVKVKNNILHVRSPYAMVGYLNASNPFDGEGWYDTGDEVKEEGDYIHILGRVEEIINVAGEKVYPAEVEGILSKIPNVKDVVVKGKKNPITGQIVTAEFQVIEKENALDFKRRVMVYCNKELESYKIPRIITISEQPFMGINFKKKRL